MTRDVYAADDSPPSVEVSGPASVVRYEVIGDAQPDLLLRVCSQLLLANVLPSRLLLLRKSSDTASIEIEASGISASLANSMLRKIAQLSCVQSIRLHGR
jgi:hypothetical protein